jgi:pyridoxal phosphate enzyme (YggS family)
MSLEERLADINRRIADACERAGRSRDTVTLVAVAKTFPADRVAAAVAAGATDIGENRAQELKEKAAVLGDIVRWHFIGPLQTNKVRQVVGIATLIHSVDRFGLGEAIARRARSLGLVQDVLVEVNIAGEASKAGAAPPEVTGLASELDALEGLRVTGLMAIPPPTDTPEEAREHFSQLARLRDEVVTRVPGAVHLSMGMTSDFEIAIESGATHVRVGRAIFGPRSR